MEAAWQEGHKGLGRYPVMAMFWMVGVYYALGYLIEGLIQINLYVWPETAPFLWYWWADFYSPVGQYGWAGVLLFVLAINLYWAHRVNVLRETIKLGELGPWVLFLAFAAVGFTWAADTLIFEATDHFIGTTPEYPWRPDWYLPPMPELFASEVLLSLVLAPLLEEVAFRGVGIGCLRARGWGPAASVTVVALLFAIVHTQYVPSGIFAIFVSGLLLGALRLRTGGIAVPIVAHFGMNVLYIYWYAQEMNASGSIMIP